MTPELKMLTDIAIDLLKKHQPKRAAALLAAKVRKNRKLLMAMSLDFLERLRNQSSLDDHDRCVSSLGRGHSNVDSQYADASAISSTPRQFVHDDHADVARASGDGHGVVDSHKEHAVPTTSPSVKVSSYSVPAHKRRSPGEVQAAIDSRMRSASAIFETRRIGGKAIGDFVWRELKGIVRDQAKNAASYLALGTEATENAILLAKVHDYAVTTNDGAAVRDVVPAAELMRMALEAKREAPAFIEQSMATYAAQLENRVIEQPVPA